MKISLNWLKTYIDVDLPDQELSELLTNTGLEVEGIEQYEQVKNSLRGLVIGEVLECRPHPNADKLKCTKVDIGADTHKDIVCGAPNVAAGQKVVVATTGTSLYPTSGGEFKIKKSKIRGEVSEGMICAEDEIGLGDSHEGILILDTPLPNGTPANEYFQLETDTVFEIGLTPNRADAASHIGVARDIKAAIKSEVRWPGTDSFHVDDESLPIEVEVKDANGCPRYSAVTIKDVIIDESPAWLKQRLLSIGSTPINNVVDITNFVLHEMGQPLHAFDADKIDGKKIIVQTLPEGTPFTTLDEQSRKLTSTDLMICNAKTGMCIAGVFGGIDSGVTRKTKNIFLESAYFSPDYIRKTSAHHGLKTDAAFRFERGTDPNITIKALKRAAMLIKELAGGKIASQIIDVYPEKIPAHEINVRYQNIDRLIGQHLEPDAIKEILEWLEIKVVGEHAGGFTAIVPPYRVDVTREADLVEEVLRIYGYDNIVFSDKLSSSYLADFPEADKTDRQNRASQLLAASGYYEIQTNSLEKPLYTEQVDFLDRTNSVEILNKLSEDLGVLRQSMVFSGLEVIAHNINRRQKNLKLFEFGKTYFRSNGSYKEDELLAIWATGYHEPENWQRGASPLEFHDFYAVVHKIINKFIGNNFKTTPSDESIFELGLDIFYDDKNIGITGLLDKNISKLAEVNQPVYYAELNVTRLLLEDNGGFRFKEVPKYPEVRRDLSLVIDKNITFEQIKEVLKRKDFSILKKINVFDYYEGEKIASNKKAYALSFILQDENKTLTDKVIDKVMNQLITVYENELGAVIRK